MVETWASSFCRANADRISELPDHLLVRILSLLSMKEAARTSLLSTRWRYLFASLPHLVFDQRLLPISSDFCETHCCWDCCEIKPDEIQKWVGIVDQILSLHQSNGIQSCKIAGICLDECRSDIDRFLSFMTVKGIQRLVLKNLLDMKLYKIPSGVFHCESLRELVVRSCTVDSISFESLRRLESLKLQDVEVSEDLVSNILSSCNLLKELELCYCPGIKNLKIEIPNLLTLKVLTDWSSIIRLKNAARLVNFHLHITPSNRKRLPFQEDKKFYQFLRDIAKVKCLQLGYHIGHLCIEKLPENLSYHFPNLRTLNMVIDFNNANDARFFAVLLKGAPYLRNVTLLSHSPILESFKEKIEQDYWKKLNSFYCMRHHLVTIWINFWDFSIKRDLGILEFLLINGLVLEEMRRTPLEDYTYVNLLLTSKLELGDLAMAGNTVSFQENIQQGMSAKLYHSPPALPLQIQGQGHVLQTL
ncbi:F-box/FBD/LRR-repeat protein At1g13570-like [Tasmannia lanceolata]|uniref:F-box/FBD/LRR-repeat protein At1g13570-like n=1 Tax=Tasmannia lanceolata TaxID=3420 RepID=UPI004063653A